MYKRQVKAVREDIERVAKRLASQLRPEEQALFDVYLRMLGDDAMPGEVANKIREGVWAQGALKQVVQQYIRHFEMMDDHYLQERAVDIRDLGRRLLSHLQEGEQKHLNYPERTVLVSEELTPAMRGEVAKGPTVHRLPI